MESTPPLTARPSQSVSLKIDGISILNLPSGSVDSGAHLPFKTVVKALWNSSLLTGVLFSEPYHLIFIPCLRVGAEQQALRLWILLLHI